MPEGRGTTPGLEGRRAAPVLKRRIAVACVPRGGASFSSSSSPTDSITSLELGDSSSLLTDSLALVSVLTSSSSQIDSAALLMLGASSSSSSLSRMGSSVGL